MQGYPSPLHPPPSCITVNHNMNYGLFLFREEILTAAILNKDSDRFLIERIVSKSVLGCLNLFI